MGAKAEADHTFVCLQFQAKNISTDELFLPPAQLVIAGDVFETSKQAAGKYLPSDWQKEAYGKLAVGATSKETACFEVPLAKAAGAVTLRFEKTRWGKNSGWVAQADGQ